jgi:hypothetical protein
MNCRTTLTHTQHMRCCRPARSWPGGRPSRWRLGDDAGSASAELLIIGPPVVVSVLLSRGCRAARTARENRHDPRVAHKLGTHLSLARRSRCPWALCFRFHARADSSSRGCIQTGLIFKVPSIFIFLSVSPFLLRHR